MGARGMTFAAAAALAGSLLLSACGGPTGGGTSPATTPPASTPGSTPTTTPAPATPTTPPASAPVAKDASLQVTVRATANAKPVQYRLECKSGSAAAGSTVPDPAAACKAVLANKAAFDTKPDPTRMCNQIYAGPETATVTGTIDRTPVKSAFGRTDGCKEEVWRTLAPLFGFTAGGAK
ncbi:serine protease inhibitor [Paenarthrobacter sp. DKR-5]|uniref:serine protease inhibitor n=1 Tax=Paenarthrobacter sp. DKR-5 TaxID=2835535 RepID=UPI001BDCE456|nr:serine protease inhibitor [Paenarthrobacter sp. DKR-5]MBT1003444.1 serine protease inhibitor [Paenarthrobacter sp. DKR-5]